ncbi:UDP-N-acetylmuramoyl-L-alanine--D-glutamate ligase [Actinophytocola oryzae]|uniref:UDP-N-acetylmuramoylalanine--D-glutamate ligase n=1 Tax=Actinophytocola oryzae TaxID=502181 RepID=A0A4R7VBJ4_9PSEU|nr:UDP-N-acetylmuramoyl-L-alanine--D-glutamate ligase [Actinophytocola oryzae]TDV46307.1 UDP-N-acetylmuramoylalanine--D-glutamate ligase [Actinophytocola oryzae]
MFAGKHVLVAGAGVTGKSVASALLGVGARVTVTDGVADRLTGLPAGADTVAGLTVPPDGTDLVVTSPGWPPTTPLLVAAAEGGVEVIGEVELAWRLGMSLDAPPAWLAVTGTDGKTTTVGMLESILLASGAKAVACGNIGLPVVDAVLAGYDVLAVELSSYQLHWQSSMHADAAAVLNIAEDHLDWHGSMAAYVRDKGRVYTGAGLAVYNADDVETERLAADAVEKVGFTLGPPAPGQYGVVDGELVYGDLRLAPVAEVRPVGPHNVANALAAAALARAYGVAPEAVRAGLNAYTPPSHRVELIAEHDGVRYVNDSKATNTHAAQGSLGAFDSVVWVAGGLLHGAAVDDLVAQAATRLRGAVLIGADQDVFAAALARHAPDVPVHRVGSGDDDPMLTAVRVANAMATPGDVVLLAPAAKSHDLFASYTHRGTAFAEAVRHVLAERG